MGRGGGVGPVGMGGVGVVPIGAHIILAVLRATAEVQHEVVLAHQRHHLLQPAVGGLVFKAHRLVYHSTLGLRVIKKEKFRFRRWGSGFRVDSMDFRVQGVRIWHEVIFAC